MSVLAALSAPSGTEKEEKGAGSIMGLPPMRRRDGNRSDDEDEPVVWVVEDGKIELTLRRTRERVNDLAGERRRVPPPLVERQVDEGNRSHGAMLGRVVQVVRAGDRRRRCGWWPGRPRPGSYRRTGGALAYAEDARPSLDRKSVV